MFCTGELEAYGCGKKWRIVVKKVRDPSEEEDARRSVSTEMRRLELFLARYHEVLSLQTC